MNASNTASGQLALPAQSDNSPNFTGQRLGPLRCELLAELIGNSLFSKEEQLRANHNAHECECPQRLALWLCNVQREAARREREERIRVLDARIAYLEGERAHPLCDAATLDNELQCLLNCAALPKTDRQAIRHVLEIPNVTINKALLVNSAYGSVLEQMGRLGNHNEILN